MGIDKVKRPIFTTITLSNKDVCDIIEARGYDISLANFNYNKYGEMVNADLTPFIFSLFCRINGKEKDVHYYLNLDIDDYLEITNVIGLYFKKINLTI